MQHTLNSIVYRFKWQTETVKMLSTKRSILILKNKTIIYVRIEWFNNAIAWIGQKINRILLWAWIIFDTVDDLGAAFFLLSNYLFLFWCTHISLHYTTPTKLENMKPFFFFMRMNFVCVCFSLCCRIHWNMKNKNNKTTIK